MQRERILWGSILFAALAAFFSVYQFYFKEKLAAYAKDTLALKHAEESYKHLSDIFSNTKPDDVIEMWRNVVQPWKDAVLDRGKFFNDGGWWEHTKPTPEVPILRFWYDEQMQKELTKLYNTDVAAAQGQGLQMFPQYVDLLKEFKVATLADLQTLNTDVTAQDINRELGKLAFGMNVCRMLLKAKAVGISQVWLWPGRELKEQEGLIRLWTVGLDVAMDMKSLVNFIESTLRTGPRYFTIEGIKIQYPYVGYNVEPMLRVQMLLTSATFIEAKAGTLDNGTVGGNVVNTYNLKGGANAAKPPPEAPTGLEAWWKWFLRDILYIK